MSKKTEFFGMRVNEDERRVIGQLADRLERTPSDAVRFIIRRAAREFALEEAGRQTAVSQGVQREAER